MPGAVATLAVNTFFGAGTLAAGSGFGAAFGASLAVGATYTAAYAATAYTLLEGSQTLLAPDKIDPSDQQREVLVRSATQPQSVIYGETVVGGLLAYLNQRKEAGSTDNFDLYVAVVHAAHEVESLTDLWYEDDLIEDGVHLNWATGELTGGDWYATSSGQVSVEIERHLGTSTQTVSTLLNNAFPTDFTSAHRLRGLCYTVHRFRRFSTSEEIFSGGQPQNIRARIQGKNDVYDQRLDTSPGANPDTSSYAAYTTNPVLICQDYLHTYMGIAHDRIDYAFNEAEADHCDEQVEVPPAASPAETQARFTFNGMLSLGATHSNNVGAILGSCMGRLVKVGGKYRILVGRYRTPTVTIDGLDDVVGPVALETAIPRRERFNRIKGTFWSENNSFVESEFIPVEDAGLVTRDNGEEITRSVQYLGVTNEYQAQRLAYLELQQTNRQKVISVPLRWVGLKLTVGTYVEFTYDKFDWTSKVFEVVGLKINPFSDSAPVEAVLREDDSSWWADPEVGDYSTRTSTGAITSPAPETNPPTSLTVTGVNGGISISVTQPDELQYDTVRIYASATSAWAGASRIADARASEFFLSLAEGTTRYFWARNVLDGVESDRFPDSDTSSVTATANTGDATDGADAGDNLRDEAGNVLNDIDLRNDEAVVYQLGGAENFNPSMRVSSRLANGNLAPAGWRSNAPTPGSPTYLDDTVRDVAVYAGGANATFNGTAVRIPANTEFELVALVRSSAGSVDLDLRADEYDDELGSGELYVDASGSRSDSVQRDRSVVLVNDQSIGTTWELITAAYTPTSTSKWFSPSLYHNNEPTNDIYVDYFIVRNLSTYGASAGTTLFDNAGNVIPDRTITNFDDASALGFNAAFADWDSGYPVGWTNWSGGAPTRETSITLTGSSAVRMTSSGSKRGISRNSAVTAPAVDMDFTVGAVLVGSVDVYIVSHTSGGSPGVVIDLVDGSDYHRKAISANTGATGRWQRLYFKVSENDRDSVSGSPATYDGVRVYLMASWVGLSGGLSTCDVIFDNLRFAVLDPAIENEAQVWANISGTANAPSDNADVTVDELESGVTITQGGIVMDAGGAIRTAGKTAHDNATAGVFLGREGSDYTFGVGTNTTGIQWDGSTFSVLGDLIATGNLLSNAATQVSVNTRSTTYTVDVWGEVLSTTINPGVACDALITFGGEIFGSTATFGTITLSVRLRKNSTVVWGPYLVDYPKDGTGWWTASTRVSLSGGSETLRMDAQVSSSSGTVQFTESEITVIALKR